jgi:hypothetical protein
MAGRALPARWPSSLRARYQTRATRWDALGGMACAPLMTARKFLVSNMCLSVRLLAPLLLVVSSGDRDGHSTARNTLVTHAAS